MQITIVSYSCYNDRWRDATRILARLHEVDHSKVGLGDFGKSDGFYDRQLRTFATLGESQAQVKDVETEKPVGQINHFDEMVNYFRQKELRPTERTSLVHGDFKIDNLLFHKTEPRVVAILDWELSDIGHPLSDLVQFDKPMVLDQGDYTISRCSERALRRARSN